MSKVLVTEQYLADIGSAIRSKNGSSTLYRPGAMAGAIREIETGITPTGTLPITQNGTVDVTQYASANVSVQPNLQAKTVTQNGTVKADSGYDGLSSVVVNVPNAYTAVVVGSGAYTADSVYSSNYGPEKAPGTDFINWWGSGNRSAHWWQVQFYEATIITKIKFAPYWQSGASKWYSGSVVLKASNDLSTWDELLSVSGLPMSNDQLTYDLYNAIAYTYYRFECISGDDPYTGLGKIQMYT